MDDDKIKKEETRGRKKKYKCEKCLDTGMIDTGDNWVKYCDCDVGAKNNMPFW